ncbi:MAG TPA: hypothetical protein VMV94_12460, partial [Phycisphaerae bacterium]|nr:hypothetical protein [Phycisphaerae bacterium]
IRDNQSSGPSGAGGGLSCDASTPVLANCTISRNTATVRGGGMDCTNSPNPTLTNCILWGDTPLEISIASSTPVVNYCDVQGGWSGTGNLDTDPLFVDAANGDFHLAANSPCIDAGDPASDFSLEPEPDGGRINMSTYGNTPEAECKGWLDILSYGLESKTRVGRTLFDYQLNLRIKNTSGTTATNVVAELLDVPDNVTIIDNQVNVGTISPGATVTSTDTFTIRVDRSTPVSALPISWRVTYMLDGRTEDRVLAGSLTAGTPDPSKLPIDAVPLPAGEHRVAPPGAGSAEGSPSSPAPLSGTARAQE